MAQPTKAKAIERLRKVLNEIPNLKSLHRQSPEFIKWHRNAEVAVKRVFGGDSDHIRDFSEVQYFRVRMDFNEARSKAQTDYVNGLEKAASILESMIDEINEDWDDDYSIRNNSDATVIVAGANSKVFVIHGHDEASREMVARFLKQLRLEPIILHEQANQGRTIIEKFEAHADVAFAVVLLTPDDVGALSGDKLKPRARQNVILELGFFLGKLGRSKVCTLVKDDIEKPSDYDGVVYISLDDAGAWRLKLVGELKEAGLDVDANRAL